MTTELATRMIPKDEIPVDLVRLGENENSTWIAMQELADWCVRNQGLLERGRKHGFRIGATPIVKDIIALACSTPDEAARVPS